MQNRIFKITLFAVAVAISVLIWHYLPGTILAQLAYGYYSAATNSVVSALLYTVAINAFAILLAVFFTLLKFKKKELLFIIVSFLLGSTSASYIWSSVLFYEISNIVGDRTFLILSALGIQFWKIGFILSYFYFFSLKNELSKISSYLGCYKITYGEVLRDFVLPKIRSTYIISSVLIFIFTFFDTGISEKIFQVSRGQENQLVNDWLRGLYKIYRNAQHDVAFQELLIYSAVTFLIAFLAIIIALAVSALFFNVFQKRLVLLIKNNFNESQKTKTSFYRTLLILILGIVLVYPILNPIIKHGVVYSNISVDIFETVIFTLLCSFVIVLFSLFTHFLLLKKFDFNKKATIAFLLLSFTIFLVPPAFVEKFSYLIKAKLAFLDYKVIWVCLHLIWTMPLILLFSIPIAFSINEASVKYDVIHRVNWLYSFKNNVIAKFSNTVILLFLLVSSIIWNDTAVNSIFSDNIYSFATTFNRVINNRVVDYQTANFMLLVSIFIAGVSMLLYSKAEKEINFKIQD